MNENPNKVRGRFARYPGGAVPQSDRTPEEQLAFLDSRGFTAAKERIKLLARIEKAKAEAKPPTPKKTEKAKPAKGKHPRKAKKND